MKTHCNDLEIIAKVICDRTETCCKCPLSEGECCNGILGINDSVIEMVEKWENETKK